MNTKFQFKDIKKALNRWIKSLDLYDLIIILFVFIGIFLRMEGLFGDPFWKTEIYNSWAAKNFLNGHGFSDAVGFSSPYLRGWFTTSLPIAYSFNFFGLEEFAARLPSMIVGLAAVYVIYLLSKEIGGKKVAIIATGIAFFDIWMITWHTQARMYVHNQFLYLAFIFVFRKWFERDKLNLKSKYSFILFLIGLIGIHNHIAFLAVIPVIFVFLISSLVYKFYKIEEVEKVEHGFIKNHILILTILTFTGIMYLYVNGIPFPLTGYTPDWYDAQRGVMFYLNYVSAMGGPLFLFGVGFVLMFRKIQNWILPIAFALPFIVQSLIHFKEPRLIFHLYPLYIISLSLATGQIIYLVDEYIQKPGLHTVLSIIVILSSVILVSTPFNTYETISESSHGTLQIKPDHRAPVNYIEEKKDTEDIIMSSAPAISAWYLGSADEVNYNLNPRNNKNLSGKLIDTRSGALGIENSSHATNIIQNNSGWVIADPNFQNVLSENISKVIINNSIKIEDDNWEQVDIYRFKGSEVE